MCMWVRASDHGGNLGQCAARGCGFCRDTDHGGRCGRCAGHVTGARAEPHTAADRGCARDSACAVETQVDAAVAEHFSLKIWLRLGSPLWFRKITSQVRLRFKLAAGLGELWCLDGEHSSGLSFEQVFIVALVSLVEASGRCSSALCGQS